MPNGELWPRPGVPNGPQLTARQVRLEDVLALGAPAQVVHAGQLLVRYASGGADPELDADADRLIDAYLNDPYLTR